MSLVDLAALYLLIGVACAVAVAVRSESHGHRFASSLLALVLWPLWAPIALTRARRGTPDGGTSPNLTTRIEAALLEGVRATEGTALSRLLTADAAARMVAQVRRTEERMDELDDLLSRPDLSRRDAEARVASLETSPDRGRCLTTARLHLANIERLHALRESDRRALDELTVLSTTLRTQLVLARYAGSSIEGIGDLLSELWARVEGLDEAIDQTGTPLAPSPGQGVRPPTPITDDATTHPGSGR